MSITSSTSIPGSASSRETGASVGADAIRTLIARQLRVEVERVTDEAHFTNDLGADWLDRLELMIAIEDRFAGVEFADDDVDAMEVVGDLIRYIEDRFQENGDRPRDSQRRPVAARCAKRLPRAMRSASRLSPTCRR